MMRPLQRLTIALATVLAACGRGSGSAAASSRSASRAPCRTSCARAADDPRELRVYTTTIPTAYRFVTLMHDPVYRLGTAWQNAAYNQPPHAGFHLGVGMKPR